MFNLKGRDRGSNSRDAGKAALKPALYDPPGHLTKPTMAAVPRGSPLSAAAVGDAAPAHAPASRELATPASAVSPPPAGAAQPSPETPGSKLSVGINIKLKGVEVSDCDILVIEGHVEATVHSKAMQIAKPGTLRGIAEIDVAEIDGEFSGELTARRRLVINGTGRVSGTIRYGQLIVAEGGELSGDVKRIEPSGTQGHAASGPRPDARNLAGPTQDRH